MVQKKFIDVNNTINIGSSTGNNRNRGRDFNSKE